ncbi:MAG: LysE family translocator [Roseiarcus sp.]|jgi:threonine/homoserine/homoserine lactone efflux protein
MPTALATMFPSPAVLLAFAAASVLLAATPGPDMALFLSRTLGGGRPHGFAALAGAMTGLLAHTCAAALGLSALLAASARAYDAVKLAGALYLLYLAYGALRHGAALRLEGQGGSRGGLPGSYLTGLLINLTNPKIVLFFVTFLPQFIDVGEAGASQKFFFLGLEFIAIGVAVNCAIILVASRFVAAAKANPRAIRWFDYGFAGLMGAFAARLALAGGR